MNGQAFSAATHRVRVAVWDNARFVLILLVVVAHAVSTVRMQTPLGFGLYAFIYLFHMPAMIALSGLFAKADAAPKTLRSTVQLLTVWLIWEILWAAIHALSSGRGLPDSWLIAPAWTLWFLVTLATMRILLPYIVLLRHPLLFALVLALLAGLSPAIGAQFSASRTLCFLPFFVAGWLVTNRGWLSGGWFVRPRPATRMAAVIWLLAVAATVAALSTTPQLWRIDKWLVWRDGYAILFEQAPVLGWSPQQWWAIALGGAGMRLLLLVLAATMTVALLLLIPREHSIITVWGTRTLFVYLLHGPIIQALRASGAVSWFGGFGEIGVLLLVGLGITVTVVLSLSWVTRVFRLIIEPRLDAFFHAATRR